MWKTIILERSIKNVTMLQPIILLIVLIFVNAFFACAEIAVISMNKAELKQLTAEGNKKAKKLTYLTEQPSRFLSSIQIAITLAGFLQSAFAAENFAGPLTSLLIQVGVPMPENVLRTVCVALITVILSYFNLVFGELVPKRLAMKKTEAMAMGMANILYAVAKIFTPIVWFLSASTNTVLRLMGINPKEEEEKVTEKEILIMLTEGNEQGTIRDDASEIIQNVFDFDDTSVLDLCTHRRDIILLYQEDDEKEWEETIYTSRHTFYPICGENPDDIIGILDTRDYFRMEDRSQKALMEKAVTQPFFVPEGMKANVLFQEMKEKRTYFAVVLDEYGSLAGIITLHDLMEDLVGRLDEKDEPNEADEIEEVGEDQWNIQGSALLDDVAEQLELDLPIDEYDTFSGYICSIIGRVPKDGESFQCETPDLLVDVHQVENHVIASTTVQKKPKEEESEDAS